jgi:hypothetical protein
MSYSRADVAAAERLARFLEQAGIVVWYDYVLAVGERFDAVIQEQIDTCAALIVILSPRAVRSEWVGREIAYAQYKRKAVLPLLLEPCDPPISLITTQFEDITGGRMPPQRFLDQLQGIAGPAPAAAPAITAGRGDRATFGDHPSRTSVGQEYRLALDLIDGVPGPAPELLAGVSYGEGPQRRRIPATRLRFLPPDWSPVGEAESNESWTPRDLLSEADRAELENGFRDAFPHELTVRGTRSRPQSSVALYIVSDLPYFQGIDQSGRPEYAISGLLGQGGIMPFLSFRSGRLELGDQLGGVALVVAVEFQGDEPVARSPYLLAARRGIRYPEDRWLSARTGRPVLSKEDPVDAADARFVFQSARPNGFSSDVFVADLDGERMFNLSYKEIDASDGFGPEEDEVVCWLDPTHIQYATFRRGRGSVVVRPDPAAALSDVDSRPPVV